MSQAEEPLASMPIPYARTALPMTLGIVFVFGFVALAVSNLVNITTLPWFAILASIAWPALVGGVIWMFIHEDGLKSVCVNLLGCYARKQFVDVIYNNGGGVVGVGYKQFGRRWYYVRIKTEFIVSVEWSTGQATHMAGRDMGDWTVWVWYRDPDGPERSIGSQSRMDYELYQVGPTGPREETQRLGLELVEFLRAAGLDMEAMEKDTGFNVRGRSLPPIRSDS